MSNRKRLNKNQKKRPSQQITRHLDLGSGDRRSASWQSLCRRVAWGNLPKLRAIAADLSLDFRDDYSGRRMYGATCPALVVNHPGDFEGFSARLSAIDRDILGPVFVDDLGMGKIYYWRWYSTGWLEVPLTANINAWQAEYHWGEYIDICCPHRRVIEVLNVWNHTNDVPAEDAPDDPLALEAILKRWLDANRAWMIEYCRNCRP